MAALRHLHIYFPEELLYVIWSNFGLVNECC